MLIYYLDALKALKAIKYANAIAEALNPIASQDFTSTLAGSTHNKGLEEKAHQAFTVLVDQDLPAYVTQMYIQIVSLSISQRITGESPYRFSLQLHWLKNSTKHNHRYTRTASQRSLRRSSRGVLSDRPVQTR